MTTTRTPPVAVVDPRLPPLDDAALDGLVRYWEAANYVTAAQLYLRGPLPDRPLRPEDLKPRLLGHWGTAPGLNLVYAHLNRLVRSTGRPVLYVTGPGHGGAALVANTWLEGSWTEAYPDMPRDEHGLGRLCRGFSSPGGFPSHVSVTTPGSVHEGGELGYALVHAFGAALDDPELLVCAVVGDGEAETAPLEGSWKAHRLLNPVRDGAVLPVLHLNQYKIANPTVLGRLPREQVEAFLRGHGWEPLWVEGRDARTVHRDAARAFAQAYDRIRDVQLAARREGRVQGTPVWPVIVLRTPKGWTGPDVVDGLPIEGTFRAHQVPLPRARTDEGQLRRLDTWLRSYSPERLFGADGQLHPDLQQQLPVGDSRLGAGAAANGGRRTRDLLLRPWRAHALPLDPDRRGSVAAETTRPLGLLLRDAYRDNPDTFRLFSPDELLSNRLGAVLDVSDRCLVTEIDPHDDRVSPEGRVMEILSEHLCQGWLEGYTLTGRHGLFATYEAFAMVSASMLVQHSKWLQESLRLAWRVPVPSLNVLLTSTCWRNDHNGFSHQGPGLIDTMLPLSPQVVRVWLPPDANCLLSVADHCLRSRDHVNLLVADKQSHLQYLTADEAAEHCARGASVWPWAGSERAGGPDVVLAAVGDVPTLEVLAAAQLLREHVPELSVRVVNVVDLMALIPREVHPHGFPAEVFEELFPERAHVVMAFHGYARAVHQLLHGRPQPDRFHVHGFTEQGTTTTPFDMVVRNGMSRYHLARDAVRRSTRQVPGTPALLARCDAQLARHAAYIVEHLEDMPEVRDWTLS